MSIARLKEFLRQIIVAVWGENVLSDTVVSTGALGVQLETADCSSKWHFHSNREEGRGVISVSETDRVIIKRCNEAYATLFQGAVARIRHTLGAWLNQRKKLRCFSTISWLAVYPSEPSRDFFWICCNHRSNECTVTHAGYGEVVTAKLDNLTPGGSSNWG